MTVPLKVPSVGESIQEVQIAQWLKQDGDWVEQDEDVVEIDTDKASLCIAAPVTGRITNIQKRDGDAAMVGDVIAEIDDAVKREPDETAKQRVAISHTASDDGVEVPAVSTSQPADDDVRTAASAEAAVAAELRTPTDATSKDRQVERRDGQRIPPAQNVTVEREEELVPMSMIRRRIATRLVEAQQKGALLTTFNEIEMSAVIKLRSDLRKPFQERYGVKLGFMSFFVKAAIEALRVFPEVNAEVRGDQIVYHKYCDIGVAIGAGKGLVVPVLRNAERLSFAEIESTIDDFAIRAQNNKLGPKELIGGTFTISNGGVYGSLLSTPIINPPQSGVLGMHAIQDRPVASDGIVVIRPMMYVALTYDHRIVDGREAVGFLRRIKDLVEEPARILLEV